MKVGVAKGETRRHGKNLVYSQEEVSAAWDRVESGEVWADVEGYSNYVVSNYGEVVNTKYHRSLKARPNEQGYLRVSLSEGGKIRQFYVHQLVARAFLGGWRHGLQVRHFDGDKSNNHVSNLRFRNGRNPRDVIPESRPKRGRRVRIRETGEVFLSARACAAYIGGDYSSVYSCIRNPKKTHKGYTFEFYEE